MSHFNFKRWVITYTTGYRQIRATKTKARLILNLVSFVSFIFYLLYRRKCEYKKNELLALELAKKENVAEIVEFYGVKIKGGNACIFMEFMAGKEKRMYETKLYHVAEYWE